MPNVAQALKAEIVRLSRMEIKAFVNPIRRSSVILKKNVAELKKRIFIIESENKRLLSFHKKAQDPQVPPDVVAKVRISSKGIRKLRTKLGLSQESFAKLLGVSSQAVYAMEHKDGRLKLRSTTLAHLLSVREMGKREAKRRLEEIEGKKQGEKVG